MKRDYSLADIAEFLGAELRGDSSTRISGLNTLQNAGAGELAFLANPKYASQLAETRAEAVILSADQAAAASGNCLILDNPYLGYAKISAWFTTAACQGPGIDASAVIHANAMVKDDVYIGPNVVVESGAKIESGCSIAANCFIGSGSVLGENCQLSANVSIYHDVSLGKRVRVHSGAVIGADGFGFAPNGQGGWQKIHQIGGVRLGDDVEIGACTTIDRGALGDTLIGSMVIIDNHVQIAHNCVIGDGTAMAAYAAIAGSSTLGRNCIIGGGACIVGHVQICDNVMLTAKTLATKNITEPGSYSSIVTPLMTTAEWRKNSVRIGQLDNMAKRIKKVERNTPSAPDKQ
jgi:UDP-3-O-[3-hydroxymyristoyl] glucosamine N-acyltransferase